jgi:hypothetical protein
MAHYGPDVKAGVPAARLRRGSYAAQEASYYEPRRSAHRAVKRVGKTGRGLCAKRTHGEGCGGRHHRRALPYVGLYVGITALWHTLGPPQETCVGARGGCNERCCVECEAFPGIPTFTFQIFPPLCLCFSRFATVPGTISSFSGRKRGRYIGRAAVPLYPRGPVLGQWYSSAVAGR